jgi:hypothetical protein
MEAVGIDSLQLLPHLGRDPTAGGNFPLNPVFGMVQSRVTLDGAQWRASRRHKAFQVSGLWHGWRPERGRKV